MPRYESAAGRAAGLPGPSRPDRSHSPGRRGSAPAVLLALQRSAGNTAVVAFLQAARAGGRIAAPTMQRSAVSDVLRTSGRPLDTPVRHDMEARLGADFSSVRVHTGPAAGRSAAAIGARAYTSGDHVVLGPGADDRHTLAHELIHVIQQRRGPVAGTDRGDGLRISDPADHDERAAEDTARRALRRRAAEVPPDTPHAHVGPASDHLTVQRKVGIEIETGWYVNQAVKPLIGKPKAGPRLERYTLVGEPFDGFKVTADIARNGRSEIEFVVEPPVEESEDGRQRLETVMQSLTGIGKGMTAAAQGKEHFTMDKATGRKSDESFFITPNGILDGSPQVTVGLSLDSITRMAPRPQPAAAPGQQPPPQPPQDRPAPEAMAPGAAYIAAQARRVTGKGAVPTPSDDLRGLIAVISSYIIKGSTTQPLRYTKQIANVLMARTDFAKLFTMLPDGERTILKEDPDLWVEMVLAAASAGKFGGTIAQDDTVFKHPPENSSSQVKLTIKDWLTGITRGEDRLKTAYRGTRLGHMNGKVEEVGPPDARREAGIFEFRASQTHKLPLDKWKDFAIEAHQYITRLNGG